MRIEERLKPAGAVVLARERHGLTIHFTRATRSLQAALSMLEGSLDI